MNYSLPALCSALVLTSCAGVRVTDTQVASGAANPTAIYIRPFDVSATEFVGDHAGGPGEAPIRQSLAGREVAQALQVELSKLAPAMVIENDEWPEDGWVVTGTLDRVNAGDLTGRRFLNVTTVGASEVRMHVRVREVGKSGRGGDEKDLSKLSRRGSVIYEFDLAGGSNGTGHVGSLVAPGLGYSAPFDYKNAAERVMMALSIDPLRTGERTTPSIRY